MTVEIDMVAIYLIESGVWVPENCTSPDHGVVAVGWNATDPTDPNQGIIKIRNSWGASWGSKGYFYVQNNYSLDSSCFLQNQGLIPLFSAPQCTNLSTTFFGENSWSANSGQAATVSFSAKSAIQMQVSSNTTNAPNYYVYFSTKNNNATIVATDPNYQNVLCSVPYNIIISGSYNYTVTFTPNGLTWSVGDEDVSFSCNTNINSAGPIAVSFAGNGFWNSNICNVAVTNN